MNSESKPANLVVLDRDGVINRDSDAYVKSVAEWIPLPGSIEAIARLSKAGYQIAIATNQSGLARGYFSPKDLEEMHQKMVALVTEAGGQIDYIAWCPHGPDDGCDCRKPLPGLLDQIERGLSLKVTDCYIVGDSLRDLQAGEQKGMKQALVLSGKGQRTLDKYGAESEELSSAEIFSDLSAFVDSLITN